MIYLEFARTVTHHIVKHEQALEAFRGLLRLCEGVPVGQVWLKRLLVDLFVQRTQQLAYIRFLAHAHPQDFFKGRAHLSVVHHCDGHRGFTCGLLVSQLAITRPGADGRRCRVRTGRSEGGRGAREIPYRRRPFRGLMICVWPFQK